MEKVGGRNTSLCTGAGAEDVVPAAGPANLRCLTKLHSDLEIPTLWDYLACGLGAAGGFTAAGQLDLSSDNAAVGAVGACPLVVGQDQVHVVEDIHVVL